MTSYLDVLGIIKEILFPIFCLSCDKEGVWVCDNCFNYLLPEAQLFCPVCHETRPFGRACEKCYAKSYITKHIAVIPYREDALIGKMIHVWKYKYAEDVESVIFRMLKIFTSKYTEYFRGIDIIIPVPLHKKRYAERGFNQATHIAGALSMLLSIPTKEHLLRRVRYTHKQAKLDKHGRLKNVLCAFVCEESIDIKGKQVLLVDDVFTTGATMQECAKALLDSGASDVTACTLARG